MVKIRVPTIAMIIVQSLTSFAAEDYDFSNLTRKDLDSHVELKKNLPADSKIKNCLFSIVIPKGWSINPVGPSDKMKCSITATPSEDVENDKSYIGLHARKDPSKLSLEERMKRYQLEGKEVSLKTWGGIKWVFMRTIRSNDKITEWAGFAVRGNQEFWLVAAAPSGNESEMARSIEKVMSSVIFK